MTREQYDELSAPLVRVLLDMEDDILREIAAQLSRDGDISDTSKWRIRQLARAGRFDKRAAAIIAGYSEVEDGQAMDAVLTAAETEIGYLDNAVQAANAAGLSEYFSDIPAEESALGAAKAFQKQAASDLNLVNTVMQYKAGSAYVNAVNAIYRDTAEGRQGALDIMGKGAAKAVSGQMSLQEATRKTIRELAQKGIPAFVDKRGREWSPEAYVMMDMRSTLGNTARAAQNARCDEYNIQLIEVSSHMGARPLCAPYQGRIFSRDGSKGVTTDGAGGKIYYTPLSETSYGQPAGLFGINCGHVQYPFVPGINFQRYFPYPKEENDRRYMQFQQQRAMERGIRAAKRECMMLQETGDTEGLQKASLRLRNQREKYRAYCKETGLKQHNDRTQVYGYDRSKSSKTVWAERKAAPKGLTGGGNGGIINNNPSSFTQCQNFDELEKYLSTKYSISLNNTVKSLDFAACREALKGVENVFYEFPVLGAYIKEITTDSSGVMSCDGRSITFNPFYFGSNNSLQKLQNICQQQTSVGHWIKNSSLSSIGTHEAGHGIEWILDDSNPLYIFDFQKNLAWNDCTEAKAIVSQAIKNVKATPYGKGKKKADLIKSVSGYASTTESEALAEAFADVFANGTNANPLSIEIKRLTIEQMKKYNKI